VTLAGFIASRPATQIEQDAWRFEKALREIQKLTDCGIARGIAAAALARDRDEQQRLAAAQDTVEGVPV
jgi:hypothetical protein